MKFLIIVSLLAYTSYAGYILALNDTFKDLSNWLPSVEPGADSGNSEWEYYTDSPNNVFTTQINGQNALVLRALAQSYQGYNYTSGKVITVRPWGPYGFFNIKAVVPKGNGLWPAIWLLPPNAQTIYGTWPACGEIDIMETVCTNSSGYSTIHFGGEWPNGAQWPNNGYNMWSFLPNWTAVHWYGLDWQPNYINFWLDAQMINGKITGGQLLFNIPSSRWYALNSNGQRYPGNAPFNVPFNIILNVAVGGFWPCWEGCCENLAIPAQMEIYNVQIWQNSQSEEEK